MRAPLKKEEESHNSFKDTKGKNYKAEKKDPVISKYSTGRLLAYV